MTARLTHEARELLEAEAQFLEDMEFLDDGEDGAQKLQVALRTLLDWYDQWVLDMEACKNG